MQRGLSIIEVLIALAITASVITATTSMVLNMPVALENARLERDAYAYASALLAHTEQSSFQTPGQVASVPTTTVNNYEGSLAVDYLYDELAARITARVEWTDLYGNNAHIAMRSLVTDTALGRDISCNPFLNNNWRSPVIHASYTLAPDELLPANYPAVPYAITSLAVLGKTLVLGSNTSATSSQPTLFFFRLTNSGTPIFVQATDNAAVSRVGVNAIAAGNDHVFVANGFGSQSTATCLQGIDCAQIHVYSLAESAPRLSAAIRLSADTPPYAKTASGSTAAAQSIAYRRGLVFVGLEKTNNGHEFNIIDVRNPASPTWLGGIAIGRSVEHIAITRTHAYLATSDSANELIVIDIKDPAHPVRVGSWNAPGSANFGLGSFVAVRGPLTFFGRTYTGNAPEFSIVHTEFPQHISSLSSVDTGTLTSPQGVRGIVVRESLAAIMSGDSIHFWNIDNPAVPTKYADPLRLSGAGTDLACSGNDLIGSTEEEGTGRLFIIKGS